MVGSEQWQNRTRHQRRSCRDGLGRRVAVGGLRGIERLHWRLWNGNAQDAHISIERVRAVMHHFHAEQGRRRSIAPSRKLWTALHALDG